MSRKRDRASAQGLLPLMESRVWRDGVTVSYRYHPRGGKPTRWTTDRDAVMRMVLDLNRRAPDAGTFEEMWRLYKQSHEWADLADGTKVDYELCWTQLKPRFGAMRPADLRAQDCSRYLRRERASAPVRANREIALLSNLMNVAIDTGDAEINVCKHVKRNKERPRRNAPDPVTLARFVSWAWGRGGSAAVLAGMAEFAARSGNRRMEFRTLHWPQVGEREIRLFRGKQRKGMPPVVEVIEVSPELAQLLARMREISGHDKAGPVFPAARGGAYGDRAFKSAWQRLMADARSTDFGPPVLAETERFTFHDLRSFYVTQHKAATGEVPELHANKAFTQRTYDSTKVVRRISL